MKSKTYFEGAKRSRALKIGHAKRRLRESWSRRNEPAHRQWVRKELSTLKWFRDNPVIDLGY